VTPSVIRVAREADAAAVQAIYAPVVKETAISFELEPPSVDEMASRLAAVAKAGLPWLVLEQGGVVRGYAYASPHAARAGYRWAVDVSAYVAAEHRGRGVGRALYEPLLALVEAQGHVAACAGIALPNEASVRLHESLGFHLIGVYPAIGWKLGAWHDVGWWQCPLASRGEPPPEPLRIEALLATERGRALIPSSS
jgi:L-amino acid N-acyltransferase YncA